MLAGFAHPRSLVALKRFGKAPSGVLSDTTGLDGAAGTSSPSRGPRLRNGR